MKVLKVTVSGLLVAILLALTYATFSQQRLISQIRAKVSQLEQVSQRDSVISQLSESVTVLTNIVQTQQCYLIQLQAELDSFKALSAKTSKSKALVRRQLRLQEQFDGQPVWRKMSDGNTGSFYPAALEKSPLMLKPPVGYVKGDSVLVKGYVTIDFEAYPGNDTLGLSRVYKGKKFLQSINARVGPGEVCFGLPVTESSPDSIPERGVLLMVIKPKPVLRDTVFMITSITDTSQPQRTTPQIIEKTKDIFENVHIGGGASSWLAEEGDITSPVVEMRFDLPKQLSVYGSIGRYLNQADPLGDRYDFTASLGLEYLPLRFGVFRLGPAVQYSWNQNVFDRGDYDGEWAEDASDFFGGLSLRHWKFTHRLLFGRPEYTLANQFTGQRVNSLLLQTIFYFK